MPRSRSRERIRLLWVTGPMLGDCAMGAVGMGAVGSSAVGLSAVG